MYITEKYWGDYLGGTDDSLILLDYLGKKGKAELSLAEIFDDFGVARLEGNFQNPVESLSYTTPEGDELPIDCAVDFITDLAALLLECRVSGSLDPEALEVDTPLPAISITATPKELETVRQALEAFIAAPQESSLNELVPEADLLEMAAHCQKVQQELFY
ncbi:MAG: hypothetical protein HFF11_10995 [Angelakisella sp.]|nr:hypothetical protein [Angelakisella sp.]